MADIQKQAIRHANILNKVLTLRNKPTKSLIILS